MSDQSVTARLAELFKRTDFTPAAAAAPRQPDTARNAPVSGDGFVLEPPSAEPGPGRTGWLDAKAKAEAQLARSRSRDFAILERRGCDHKWSVENGRRTCWLCGHDGGAVDGARLSIIELEAQAEMDARAMGHKLREWKKRPNDAYGRRNGYCARCNKLVVVSVEQAPGLPLVYGDALQTRCGD